MDIEEYSLFEANDLLMENVEKAANGNQGWKYQKSTDSTQSVSQLTAIVRGEIS